ncbi:MAG: aminotransferase class III-fold pyridoxal phosphate-dependent enzyme [Caldilinea sp.]|uniref:aminotransferase class III-fold pyridoxal phosphate-dependent enzyme n=1 Tax=Caldilinea sp. TaxID=2293560 RepID=UPI0030A7DF72
MSFVLTAPRFDLREAAAIALEQYGVSGAMRPLPSERDQNFYIRTASGEEFVLKIANAEESLDLLDAQNHALKRMAQAGLPLSGAAVMRTLNNETIARAQDAAGERYFVRMLRYIPGAPLATVRPHSPELLADLGRFLGEVDRALADYDHPALHRTFHWDLAHAGDVVRSQLNSLPDANRRALVRTLLERFERHTEPALAALPHQVIHGDANDYNVLVSQEGDLFTRYRRIAGILDLGDMVYSLRVADLAIAAAYALLDKDDPLQAAAQVTTGYYAVNPLTEAEIAALWDLICMRLCVSVCHAAVQRSQRPDNHYLSISERAAWAALEKLVQIHPRLAHYALRAACGLTPVPQAPALIDWLQRQPTFAPVIGHDLRMTPVHVLDLSIGSLTITSQMLHSRRGDLLSAAIFGEMAQRGAVVGVGRHAEPRALCIVEPAFAPGDNPTGERRTLHLGIDLFAPPGTPVYAPLAGVVHALHHNAVDHESGPTVILRHHTDDGLTFYTLYGHLDPGSLERLKVGETIAAGEQFASIGATSVNGGWPPHLHLQLIADLLELDHNFPGVVAPAQATLWTSLCPDPNLLLRIPAEQFPPPPPSPEETLAERRKRIGRNLSISYRRPLKIVRGLAQYLYDDAGRAYLDAVNNVAHVGHCHPDVVAAGQRQMAVLNTNTRYLHDAIVEYARRLSATLPPELSVFFFVNSGSEANDLALRLARTATGRQDVITVDVAYHGHTQALIEISPYKHDGPGGKGRPPYVQKVIMPDPYRGPYTGYSVESGKRYAMHVQQAIEQIHAQGRGVAAFICESLPGCGGQIVFPPGYMAEAFRYVRAAGGVCIADEVQVGFGRVGSHFWGFQTQGVTPDIVTMGKPAGNGHPLAVVATTPEIADRFANGMEYFNTFGGNPVSCAIGLAVLDVIERERLQQNAFEVGAYLREGLRRLQARHPLIGDVRGLGLYIGVELVLDPETLEPAGEHAAYVANRMRDYGVLISTDGPFHNVLKIKPPIIFSRSDADHLLWALGEVLQDSVLESVDAIQQ